jgi:polyisoprenoid-binding protein YceI
MKPLARSALVILLAALAQACGATAPSEPPLATQAPEPPATAAPDAAPTSEAADPGATSGLEGAILFRIDPAASEVRFSIDEILRGSPNTVIGTTRGVSGELVADQADPALSTIGPISIDAGSFVTDNGFRDRAIDQFILQASSFPTLTFVSSAMAEIPAAVAPGESLTFSVTGDLTIREITLPVTFEVSLNVESPDRLTGTATATIRRSDFRLTIPSVPQVAEVSEEVILEFDFTAVRAS